MIYSHGSLSVIARTTVCMIGLRLAEGRRDKTSCGNPIRWAGAAAKKRGGCAWNQTQQQGLRNNQYLGHCDAIQLWRGVK